jgi:glutathione S-transferase
MEQQLHSHGTYILGRQISIADFSIYHCLWFINHNLGVNKFLNGYQKLNQQFESMKAIGHRSQIHIDAKAAIDTAYLASKGEQTVIFSRKWF